MKSLSFLWVALFLFVSTPVCMADQISNLASEMAAGIEESGKKTIAVADFTDLQGNVTELGRFLAEEFSVSLADAGKGFEAVDRTHLKSIISENKLSTTGLIDSAAARRGANQPRIYGPSEAKTNHHYI